MASKRTDPRDPYAPPPMYHDRSGRVVRIGLMAILLAAGAAFYFRRRYPPPHRFWYKTYHYCSSH